MSGTSGTREVLVCSGLDPSGGAGFIADVRVVGTLGARAVGVVTALTVQNTVAVQSVEAADAQVVGTQLAALLSDVEVHAVKLGLLGSIAMAKEISFGLDLTAAPVVWDPIAAPTRGRVEFDAPMLVEMMHILGAHLRLITPNALELALLAGRDITSRDDAIRAAREIIAAVGGVSVLVKGGHGPGDGPAVDLLVDADRVEELSAPRRPGGEDVHGTGCALSTAIATRLALGDDLVTACRAAKEFVTARLAAPVHPGRGAAAVV